MHKHTIDWLRKINLHADAKLAEERWKLATDFEKKVTRKEMLTLLRAFLFDPVPAELIQSLSDQFQEMDREFPGLDNAQEVKLMAGLIMLVAFGDRNAKADAFALGIRAAAFPKDRCKSAHPHIVVEAEKYLEAESGILRPSDFGNSLKTGELYVKILEFASFATVDEQNRQSAVLNITNLLHDLYGEKIQRLAEETGLLWWLLGDYSDILKCERNGIDQEAYALVAAAEVSERTQIIPPPLSIYPILGRAISAGKATKGDITLQGLVSRADPAWRKTICINHPVNYCTDFVPILTALNKVAESGDSEILQRGLSSLCPGVTYSQKVSPSDAAKQFYNELIFLKALGELD